MSGLTICSSVRIVVEADLAVLDVDVDADRELRALVAAVVVDVALARVAPVRDLGDLGLHHPARGVEQRLLVRFVAVDAVLGQQLEHPPLADRARAHLGLHVVLDDVEPHVGEDQVPDVLAQLAAVDHLDRRDAQRLLPDLDRVRVVAAGDVAADVGLVALDCGPRDQFAVEEHRLEHRHVVVLVAQAEDVVVEDHVARMQVVAEVLLDVLADRRQREGEDRQVLGLLEHVAIAVVEAGHVVLGLAQDRRTGGLLHRDAHLVGDRAERARVDRQQDGVDFHGVGGAHVGVSVEVQAATGAGSATAAGPNADRQRSSRPLR
jgi:hypothetical protein